MAYTTDFYWDCECKDNYIHSVHRGNFCPVCVTHASDAGDSIRTEVLQSYNPDLDQAIFVDFDNSNKK